MLVAGGSTDVTTYFAMRLTADGKAATGLTITDFDLQYVRSGVAPVAKVDATALVATDSTHADNKAIEIDATDQPGLYRVDWPDPAFAADVREVILSVKVATAFTEHLRVEIDGEVNVVEWAGTDVTISATSAKPEMDVNSISDDATAANNLELMYDTTGYTDDTAPASRSQVDGISGGTGGSVNIAANSDNTISDTIDNAAAVDKTGGLVGIPITGHAYAAGNEVTIASTTNYNGSFDIVSQTTNEIVITASFVSETFGGTETCNSTIQTVAFVGSVTSGTFANTQVLDDVDHVFTDTGDVIDVAYRFTIGGGRSATSVLFTGNVNGNNDEILLKAYDFVGTTWDTVGVIDGSGGSTNRNVEASLLQRHTGTGGDLGNVFIRLDTDTTTPSDLEVALLLVSAVSIGQTVGYQLGAVWIDTDDGVSGTESFVNGVADNPCLTLANAITIGSNVGLHRFVLTPESSITFGETHTNELWTGLGWTLALGNRDIGGSHFNGADVTGTGTGSVEVHFDHCEVGTCTLIEAHLDFCDISGTITLSAAATYTFVDCSHAGSGAIIDFGSTVGNTTVHVHNYHGALTVKNMGQNGTDVLHFSSPDGKLTLDNTNTGGTVNLNGTFDFVNSGSGMTINSDGAILAPITLPGQTAPPLAPTSREAWSWQYKTLRNRKDQTSTLWQLYADNETTVDAKATVSDDGTTAIKQEIVTGP